MNRVLVIACALLLASCGDAEETAAPPRATATAEAKPPADRTALVADANALCKQAQPAMDRAGEAIDASASKLRKANQKAWTEQLEVMQDTFGQLRALAKPGADRPYDAFLAEWGQTLTSLGMLARDLEWADRDHLEWLAGELQTSADELADRAIAAEVLDCAAPFAPGGDPTEGEES